VLFLPGESKLAEKLAYDGAQVRLFVLDKPPLQELSEDSDRAALSKALSNHYGHIGSLLIKEIQASHRTGELQKLFEGFEKQLPIAADFQRRQRARYAAMLTGNEMFRRIVGDVYADRISEAIFQHWLEASTRETRTFVGYRALRTVLDYQTSNPAEFCTSSSLNSRKISGEMQDDGSLALVRGELKNIFQGNYDVSNVVEEWNNLGWLRLTDAERRNNSTRTRARIGLNARAWAIVLTADAVNNYYEDGTDSDFES